MKAQSLWFFFPGLGPLHGPRARATHPALPEAAQLRHCQVNLYLLCIIISHNNHPTAYQILSSPPHPKTRSQDDIYIAVTQLGGLSDCCQNLRQKNFCIISHMYYIQSNSIRR